MVVYSRANILFPDGFRLRKDDVVTVPDEVAKSSYFAALVKDGKIVVTETVKTIDKAVEKTEKKGKK